MKKNSLMLLCLAATPLFAHAAPPPVEQTNPTASINARASLEVPQDVAQASLYVEQTGTDRAALTRKVNEALQQALTVGKSYPNVSEKTAGYRSFPLYDKNQHVSGYRVRADVVLESRDFDAFSKVLTTLSSDLSVQNVGYIVSDEALQLAKGKLLKQVSIDFKTEAESVAQSFGYGAYELKDVNVNYETGGRVPYMKTMVAMASPSFEAPVPIEPGTSTISATASGSIVLH